MLGRYRRILMWGAVLSLVCAGVISPQTRKHGEAHDAHDARGARPKLVVLLVVDQMRADYVKNFHSQWTAGLARMVNQGAWFRNAKYPYLNTVTCAGHATISTGRLPSVHGIVGNSWYDGEEKKMVSCTADAKVTDSDGTEQTSHGDSAWRLEAPALADELRENGGGQTRVATFSVKARAAIMLAGHKGDVVGWHDAKSGAWETSSAYGNLDAVAGFLKAHPVSEDFGKAWTPVPPDEKFVFNVAPHGRQAIPGWNESFPHAMDGNKSSAAGASFYAQWEVSPYSSEYLVEMADAAVDSLKLGQQAGTDFLGISFSSVDSVGHTLGPYSHEMQDTLSQLDRQIGELFAHLDATVGAGNYVVALSADHGVAPIPEEGIAEGMKGGRTSDRAIRDGVERVLDKRWGGSAHVAGIVEGDLWLNAGEYSRLKGDAAAMKEVSEAIAAVPGVAHIYRSEELAARRATTDPVERAAEVGYYAGRSGDLVIALQPYWIYSEPRADGTGTGTTHGSAYEYDQRVPVLLYGWGVKHGAFDGAAAPLDIAPTLAEFCGVRMKGTDGRVLKEAVRK